MTFAIPVNNQTAIRCKAIIDRLVNYRPGTESFDEGWRHASEWLDRREANKSAHPVIALEGDAIIRALVETPSNETWLREGQEWLRGFSRAERFQRVNSVICLPDCSNTRDLISANID